MRAICSALRDGATIAAMFSITFNDASQALGDASDALSLSEAHGCLCGALCINDDYPLSRWMEELLSDEVEPLSDELVQSIRSTFKTIHADTLRALRGDELEFMPLLPDDDSPLAERTVAMAQWCQGFLYGFGVTTGDPSIGKSNGKLSPEIREVLHDVAQLARATVGDVEPTDEDENDYAEIVEYLRVGAQLIHDELQSGKAQPRHH
jgi:uncharacterized protein YgfB (UPF0149 family)